jgi:hypothetical protein
LYIIHALDGLKSLYPEKIHVWRVESGVWRVEFGVNVKTPESVDFDFNSTLQIPNSKLHQIPISHILQDRKH